MRIKSDEIPQADVLEEVIRTIICIANGGRSYQDIAKSIGKVERQGRYYRKAAEILGFISTPSTNNSILTDLGKQFIQTDPTLQNPLLLQAVMNAHVFQRVIPFFENHNEGITKAGLISYLASVSDIPEGTTMLPRRFSSVISWLETLNLIRKQGTKYFIVDTITTTLPTLLFTRDEEPILPKTGELNEYQTVEQRSSSAKEAITYYKDQASLERANNAHIHLVNLVSERIRESGNLPRYNKFIDLAARVGNQEFIFEMKSTTENNVKSQVRKGLSQLYEYRYLQNMRQASLVLVLENAVPQDLNWIQDYLIDDRGIHLIWDGNNQLYCNQTTRNQLGFLW